MIWLDENKKLHSTYLGLFQEKVKRLVSVAFAVRILSWRHQVRNSIYFLMVRDISRTLSIREGSEVVGFSRLTPS